MNGRDLAYWHLASFRCAVIECRLLGQQRTSGCAGAGLVGSEWTQSGRSTEQCSITLKRRSLSYFRTAIAKTSSWQDEPVPPAN